MKILKNIHDISHDLTSGNFTGEKGLGYPNVVDWDGVNGYWTKIWKKMTGIDETFHITTGTTAMLDLIARGENIKILCFVPVYDGAMKIFRDNKCRVYLSQSVEMMPKNDFTFIYLNTNFRNPDGYSIPEEDMHKIVAYAKKHNSIIIEDDPYFFLNKNKGTKLSFLEIYDRTIYLNSFSKCLGSPGLRMGCFASRNKELKEYTFEKMKMRFMFPPLDNILKFIEENPIKDILKKMEACRLHVDRRARDFEYTGFYAWRENDKLLEELLELGYSVKDGEWFGSFNHYRMSLNHLGRYSEEFEEIYYYTHNIK